MYGLKHEHFVSRGWLQAGPTRVWAGAALSPLLCISINPLPTYAPKCTNHMPFKVVASRHSSEKRSELKVYGIDNVVSRRHGLQLSEQSQPGTQQYTARIIQTPNGVSMAGRLGVALVPREFNPWHCRMKGGLSYNYNPRSAIGAVPGSCDMLAKRSIRRLYSQSSPSFLPATSTKSRHIEWTGVAKPLPQVQFLQLSAVSSCTARR